MTIDEALRRPANGFGLLRLLLALAVVASHGVSVVTGRVEDEPLHAWTGFTLGEHAVNAFFAVSGFLVTMSFVRRGWRDYAIARALRIAPGLVAATLAVTFVLGTALTVLPAPAYLAASGTWGFVAGTLATFKSNASLPGVFADNPFRMPMGTVWTLKYEVLCYLGTLLAGLAGLLSRRGPALAAALALLVANLVVGFALPEASLGLRTALRLACLFACGGALWMWRDRVPVSGPVAAGLAAAAILAAGGPAGPALLFLAEAYGAVWVALGPLARPACDLRHDLSYGVYLYGWPIQQALRQTWPEAGVAALLVPSVGLALAAAALSWFAVEKPALRLKARAMGRRDAALEAR